VETIDQAQFHFSPAIGTVSAFMVAFLVFAVALDLKWEQFRRVLRSPNAPAIGLLAQFVVLPAVAYVVGRAFGGAPSIALGLLLVASCPGGALSNYLTGMARGDVATSVSMTAVSTVSCIVATPLVFGFWASMNPATAALLAEVSVDPRRVVVALVVMLLLPVSAGMFISMKRPGTARTLRGPVRRAALVVFGTTVMMVLGQNARLLLGYTVEALVPVGLAFLVAVGLGWGLAQAFRLAPGDCRAVAFEVGTQNVALAIGTAVAVFPGLTGVVVTTALWGAVHVTGGLALAAAWSRAPAAQPVMAG
jgi:bile acid:Na+ symporter, BASS family